MKKLLFLFTLLSISLSSFAAGYRGLYDFYFGISTNDKSTIPFSSKSLEVKPFLGIQATTSHGCQITPFFFAGAGFGVCIDVQDIQYGFKDKLLINSLPIFLDLRWDLDIRKKITPFVDVKIGYQLGLGKSSIDFKNASNLDIYRSAASSLGDIKAKNSFYFQPTAGVRFRIRENVGFNLGVTYLPNLQRELMLIDSRVYNFKNGRCMLNIGFDF